MSASSSQDSPDVSSETSFHVRRATKGDFESLEWLTDHFHPFLLAQARYRLSRALYTRFDPEDLVQQVWCICIPKLHQIRPRDGRCTRVLLKFLSSTLLRLHNNLVSKHLKGKPATLGPSSPGDDTGCALAALPAETSGVVTSCMRRERVQALHRALEDLAENDRQILVLRGIEQLPYKVIACNLGVQEDALVMRFTRALKRLRSHLPRTIFDEISEYGVAPG